MPFLPRQDLGPEVAQSTSTPTPTAPPQVYTVAILLAVFSLLIILLILPPLFWHARNRNIGATSLVTWVIALLAFTFVNALIWPSDDTNAWFNGVGLCDVEIKIQVASQVALPASFAAVLRGLANVLDTDHATLVQTKAQRRRNTIVDLLFCVGAPLLQMASHELVHFRRYIIFGIAGCVPAVSDSWLSVALLTVVPLGWALVDAAYAALILFRLYRYRLTFSSILATSQTTKSRFLRLYLICVLWILAFLPAMLYLLGSRAHFAKSPFSWADTHSRAAHTQIFLVPSHGLLFWDRWIWLATGVVVFVFFGFGREALGMYRSALLAVGLGRVFPALRRDASRRPTVSTLGSVGSRARLLFRRKTSSLSTSQKTWTSSTSTSHVSSSRRSDGAVDEPISPKTTTFPEAIREVLDVEKAAPPQTQLSLLGRVAAFFTRAGLATRKRSSAPLELTIQDVTMKATVSAGQRPASLIAQIMDPRDAVVVRKEVRQGSEHEGA